MKILGYSTPKLCLALGENRKVNINYDSLWSVAIAIRCCTEIGHDASALLRGRLEQRRNNVRQKGHKGLADALADAREGLHHVRVLQVVVAAR
jgi:hypothetical protein